jgi:hypothetical protein
LGLVLLFWPHATLVVALVVFAVQLFATVKGLLSVGAGGFVLVNPGTSLATMLLVVWAWLLVYGIVATAVAVLTRRSP